MEKNKMAVVPLKKLFWKMGLPMIISMVLQALYNVIDSIFITNMKSDGVIANQALTLAFPIQLLIIAIGVGTGVGINALLSKSLGEQNKDKVNKIAGTGIFLSICIYIIFLIFGLFGSESFIRLFAGNNQHVIAMGTIYLKICCCFSYGSIGFTVYERLLQSTGKTHFSTIAQISGALTNIILDYIFICINIISVLYSAIQALTKIFYLVHSAQKNSHNFIVFAEMMQMEQKIVDFFSIKVYLRIKIWIQNQISKIINQKRKSKTLSKEIGIFICWVWEAGKVKRIYVKSKR